VPQLATGFKVLTSRGPHSREQRTPVQRRGALGAAGPSSRASSAAAPASSFGYHAVGGESAAQPRNTRDWRDNPGSAVDGAREAMDFPWRGVVPLGGPAFVQGVKLY